MNSVCGVQHMFLVILAGKGTVIGIGSCMLEVTLSALAGHMCFFHLITPVCIDIRLVSYRLGLVHQKSTFEMLF